MVASGSAIGQIISVLVSPILTRFYSPEDFGIFGVYASILGIFTVVASLRYEFAIPLPEEDVIAANILTLCFLLLLVSVLLSGIIVGIFGIPIVEWTNSPGLKPYLWLIPLGLLGAGIYQILSYWATRKRDFRRLGRTRFNRGVWRALLQVGLGWVQEGPLGLLFGQLAGETAGSFSLAFAIWKEDRDVFKAIQWQKIRSVGARYKRFPLLSSLAGFIDSLGLQLPQLLIASFYGAEVAGWFALGQRVIAIPLNIVMDAVAQVYFGEASNWVRNESGSVFRRILKLTGRLALIGGLPVVLICVLAPWLFKLVFGSSWEMAGLYVRIMGFMFAVRFVITPFSQTLNILERQEVYLFWDIIRFFLVVGGLLIGRFLKVSDVGAIIIYSLTMAVSYLILGYVVFNISKHKI